MRGKLNKQTSKEIEDNTVKNVRNLFRLKKETTKEISSNIVKNVRNLLKRENKIKQSKILFDNIIWDIY